MHSVSTPIPQAVECPLGVMGNMDTRAADRIYIPPRMPPSDDSRSRWQVQSAASVSRRSSNRVKVKPASPEVISSLISTLSAISSPAQHHFDRQPRAYLLETPPLAPGHVGDSLAEDAAVVAAGGFGMDYGAYNRPDRPHDDSNLHPDDAATPPVVRTSKPPSGLSPITAPKPSSLTSSNESGRKVANLHTLDAYEIPRSIGSPSIEPGPRGSSASMRSFGSGSRTGPRSPGSLSFKDSKGKMRELDRERKRKPARIGDSGSPSARHSRVSSIECTDKGSHSKYATRPGEFLPSPHIPTRVVSMSTPSDSDTNTHVADEDLSGIGGGLTIPKRDSSLRHSLEPTASRRKCTPHHPHDAYKGDGQEGQSDETDTLVVEKVSDHLEEDEVERRIRELKAQKELRDRQKHDEDELRRRESEDPSLDQFPFPIPKQSRPLHDEKIVNKPKSTATRSSGGAKLLSQPQTPLRSLSDNDVCHSVSSKRHSRTASADQTRNFENQYKTQSHSMSPLYRPPLGKSPTSLEINRGTYLNPILQAGKNSSHDERPSTSDSIDEEVENYLSLARLSQKIHHPQTGRVISFSDVGDPSGYVVICCVGMGLTRYLTAFYDELALTLKLRLITLDRPGVGESESYVDGSDTPLGWPGNILLRDSSLVHVLIQLCRRCSRCMPASQCFEVFHPGALRWSHICFGNCTTHAPAYSGPSTSSSAMDTTLSADRNWDSSRASSCDRSSILAASPTIFANTIPQSSELEFFQRHQL